MERRIIETDQLAVELGKTEGWSVKGPAIWRRFEFDNFSDALEFVNRTGDIAEAMDHHPDIKLGWGYAEFAITTHDRGGVTAVDFSLATKINEIV